MTKPTSGQEKKETTAAKPEVAHKAPEGGHKAKGYVPLPGGCQSVSCKTPASRFGFCPEHYEQFKFGLIKKTGEPVSDYEKKFEHYMAYKKRVTPKVA